MDSERWRRVQELFGEAVARPTEERAAFIAEACGDDPDLRAEVESLVAHEQRVPTGFMKPAEPPTGVRRQMVAIDTPALVGRSIGAYRIKGVIGVGGMGTVYLAEQQRPRRDVALKIMNWGVASASTMQRFEHEAEILAYLRHPNIAQVYEAGTYTPSPSQGEGRGEGLPGTVPYFAMEYIPAARKITEHAQRQGLGLRERLELFLQVCDGVQHGHQRGIIHRDLKPANILVGDESELPSVTAAAPPSADTAPPSRKAARIQDGASAPAPVINRCHTQQAARIQHAVRDSPSAIVKIIDFGVARSTDSDIAVTTIGADVGRIIGTLQYMSPEQCDADPHNVDIRSDVYSLGVVLYELLTGRLPYDVSNLTIHSAIRRICEQAPTKPSEISKGGAGVSPAHRPLWRRHVWHRRLGGGTTGGTPVPQVPLAPQIPPVPHREGEAPAEPRGRGVAPRLPTTGGTPVPQNPPVKGDLETIVLKALEKDREKRYQSVAELAADIRCYLNREPIQARPPTAWTRAIRWAARHPLAVATAAGLVIAAFTVAGGGVTTYWLNLRPDRIEVMEKGRYARLLSVAGRELHKWPPDADPGEDRVMVATLVDRPESHGSGRLAVVGYTISPRNGEYAGQLCAYDLEGNFDKPVWRRAIHDEDLPADQLARGRAVLDCHPVRLLVADVFPEPKGAPRADEIIVCFALGQFSQRAIRIYDAKGNLQYQVWQDGGIYSAQWLSGPRLLVFAGGSEKVKEAAQRSVDVPQPFGHVLFAIKPVPGPGSIRNKYLENPANQGPERLAWYRYVHPLSTGKFRFHVYVRPPSCKYDSAKFTAVSIEIGEPALSSVGFIIDEFGQGRPHTRVVSDEYNRLAPQGHLPSPDIFQLRDDPPTTVWTPP